jgi:hypothetical protein
MLLTSFFIHSLLHDVWRRERATSCMLHMSSFLFSLHAKSFYVRNFRTLYVTKRGTGASVK